MNALLIEQNHVFISKVFLLLSIPTYVITRYGIVAPFGRHVQDGKKYRWWFGPQFDAKLSWFLFESPNLIWSWYCYFYLRDFNIMSRSFASILSVDNNQLQLSSNAMLLGLFTLHYINRAIIYPLRMNSNSHRVPLIVTASACVVTILNGYIQTFYLVRVHKFASLTLPPSSWNNLQSWLGILVFVIGMTINVQSDGVLRNLGRQRRSDGVYPKTYYIPQHPLFTYISCPNFFGEILEWFGFAIASQFSLPATAFFLYTSSNLIPRGIAHHEWYKQKFEDYPKERKWAVIPFVV
jgi:3-oxo-5-alpha-steroid 4-dehydrogenase 1